MSPLRIAFYGGSFDPPHLGHMAIAQALLRQFELDEFVFIPAFHAPHKKRTVPTPAYDRYAMLCLATQNESNISVSRIEIEMPERPYSIETLGRLRDMLPREEIFFVMGADSWSEITTWRDWQRLLEITNHIVVTRPGYDVGTSHVTDDTRERIVDLRGLEGSVSENMGKGPTHVDGESKIYLTDRVNLDISATAIRNSIHDKIDWELNVPIEVANYIEKYQIYS